MLAVTEVLDEDADRLAPDTAAAVRLISAETGELAVLVEDLMEISRFDARAAELHTDEVDVVQAIRKTLSSRHWNDEKQVTTDLPDGVTARLDPRRFDVVIANLVGNALRHDSAVRLRLQRTTADATVPHRSVTDDTATPAQPVVEVTEHGPASPRTRCRTSSNASTRRTRPAPVARARPRCACRRRRRARLRAGLRQRVPRRDARPGDTASTGRPAGSAVSPPRCTAERQA